MLVCVVHVGVCVVHVGVCVVHVGVCVVHDGVCGACWCVWCMMVVDTVMVHVMHFLLFLFSIRKMNELKKRQDAYNRNELKLYSKDKKSKEEIQRYTSRAMSPFCDIDNKSRYRNEK